MYSYFTHFSGHRSFYLKKKQTGRQAETRTHAHKHTHSRAHTYTHTHTLAIQ